MKKLFIHLGNPKSGSTLIQSYLDLNDSIHIEYHGFRPRNNPNEWYKSQRINVILNRDLRVINRLFFKKNLKNNIEYINELYNKAKNDIWISSENLSCRFTLEELCWDEKYERIRELFSHLAPNYLIVFRNIYKTIRSIYKEYLKRGYNQDFLYFQKELIEIQ